MRLNATISRDDFCRIFDVPPEALDALLASGRLLCQLRDGEQRIPLEQVEAFFRDGLLRLYQTEAWLGHVGAVDEAFTWLSVAPSPAPIDQTASEGAGATPSQEATEPEPEVAPAPVEPPPRAPIEKPDYRLAPRFVPRRHIDGFFNDVRFTIVQISGTGLRIRHKDPIVPGEEAKISFALLNPPRSFVMRARVVWTSYAEVEQGGEEICISGLRVTEHVERLAEAIEILRRSHDLQPDRRTTPRVARNDIDSDTGALDGISDDEVALVVRAAKRFASDPSEAGRWYGRARFAMADEQVRRSAPPKARDREEVLGIWEFLDRQVEIPKIAGVLKWMRRSRAAI